MKGLPSLLLAPALLLGCVDVREFARPSLVDRPRVVAIIAEPPEAAPGEPVALSLLLGGAASAEISWRACGAFDGFMGGGGQYGEDNDEHCGGMLGEALESGDRTRLPGELTTRLFADLGLAATILGSRLPSGLVAQIRDEVGLPFMAEASVMADGKRIRAVKRVLISERAARHSNPPAPRFALDEQEIVATDADGFRCAVVDGSTPRVPANAEVELRPLFDGELEPWLEPYAVLDTRGERVERTERAFYSWFSDAGQLDEAVTRAPNRVQRWTTPPESACHSLWLVVRDGHGGASACRTEVAVGDAQCPSP
jgi:hypothetical protein